MRRQQLMEPDFLSELLLLIIGSCDVLFPDMDGCHCIIAKVAEGRNSIREGVRRHLSILKCGTKGEKFMKIATLLLFSVMMMSPSATLFSSPQKDKPAEVDRAEHEHAGTE